MTRTAAAALSLPVADNRSWLAWVGLGVAFSPILADLAGHLLIAPWPRYAMLFPILFLLAVRDDPGATSARRFGLALVGVGLAIELLAIMAGAVRFGRVGLGIAAFGLCRAFGHASPRVAALLLFAIPLPAAVMMSVSPALETALLALAAPVVMPVTPGLTIEGTTATASAGVTLVVGTFRSGLALAPLLVGLFWYASLGAMRGPVSASVRALAKSLYGTQGQE